MGLLENLIFRVSHVWVKNEFDVPSHYSALGLAVEYIYIKKTDGGNTT
jgi:hypothetical protein